MLQRTVVAATLAATAGIASADLMPLTADGSIKADGTITPGDVYRGHRIGLFNSTSHYRYAAEFDISGLGGGVLDTASLTGELNFFQNNVSNWLGAEYYLYAGDGLVTAADWNRVDGILVGGDEVAGGVDAPLGPVDVAAAMQSIMDDNPGLGYIGVLVAPTSGSSIYYNVDNIALDVVAIPAPGALALLGLAGLARRRRRC
jgi:hypothetical protein